MLGFRSRSLTSKFRFQFLIQEDIWTGTASWMVLQWGRSPFSSPNSNPSAGTPIYSSDSAQSQRGVFVHTSSWGHCWCSICPTLKFKKAKEEWEELWAKCDILERRGFHGKSLGIRGYCSLQFNGRRLAVGNAASLSRLLLGIFQVLPFSWSVPNWQGFLHKKPVPIVWTPSAQVNAAWNTRVTLLQAADTLYRGCICLRQCMH